MHITYSTVNCKRQNKSYLIVVVPDFFKFLSCEVLPDLFV